MNIVEQPVVFACAGEELLGIVAIPEYAKTTGVLIAVGGPQTRVGSHRQFLLLSRSLAHEGYPVMRFDFRGMGDSTGDKRDFTSVSEDLAAAISAFQSVAPQIQHIVLWGLCDAASASLLYWESTRDGRLLGLVLLNPWVRSEQSLARTQVKHYYGQRLLQSEFWRKLLTGKLGISKALGGLISSLKNTLRKDVSTLTSILPFQSRMLRGMQSFSGHVLVLLSGNDYTAKEFLEVVKQDAEWSAVFKRSNITQISLAEADHTFSSAEWRGQVESHTRQWLDLKVCQ